MGEENPQRSRLRNLKTFHHCIMKKLNFGEFEKAFKSLKQNKAAGFVAIL